MSIGFVTPQQFYGMDTNAFAVELARVTLMIARKVAIDLCDIHDQPALPLDTLDANIVCKDALFTEWVKADAIIGNPPFLGGKHLRINLSDEYIDRVFARFPDVKDSVDFCAYWFRLAHDQIGETQGRAGLVGTNSVSQGKSRTAALDYVVRNGGVIHDAISTQPWSGEANVHVSIVNWYRNPSVNGRGAALGHDLSGTTEDASPNATPNHANIPEPGVASGQGMVKGGRGAALGHDLSSTTEDALPNATPNHADIPEPGVAFGQKIVKSRKNSLPNAAPLRICYLDNQPVPYINSSLKAAIDVSQAVRLKANLNWCFQGVNPLGMGFAINEKQAKQWTSKDQKNKEVLKRFLTAGDLTDNPKGEPTQWIIDFNNMSLEDASDYALPFEHVKLNVKPQRDRNRRETRRINWWKFGEKAPNMRNAVNSKQICFIVPAHSKWFIFTSVLSEWLAGHSSIVLASDDFYILGILTSNVHRTWVKAQSSTLEDRTRYTHNTCFETFPFPQTPALTLITAIRTTAQELHDYRFTQMEKKQWGITKLYNEYFHEPSSQLFKLHAKLDRLVLQAYGFHPDDDLLEKLLTLNLELAAKEKQGESVVGPWAPKNCED